MLMFEQAKLHIYPRQFGHAVASCAKEGESCNFSTEEIMALQNFNVAHKFSQNWGCSAQIWYFGRKVSDRKKLFRNSV